MSDMMATQEQFKLSLNSKLQEMAKVADLKAMFNQELPVGKPPPAVRKPPVAVVKPKPAVKIPGQMNGASNTVNGLVKELGSVRLKHSERPFPTSTSQSENQTDFRKNLRKVQDASTKPTVTPKPGVKPPVVKPPVVKVNKPPVIRSKPRVTPADSNSLTTGSISSVKSDGSREESFKLATLPSLDALGSPPQKPPKPRFVKLPLPTGVSESRSRKPVSTQPVFSPKPPEPIPPVSPIPPVEDFNETYDDVEKPPPPLPPTSSRPSLKKRISMIPTMNSDDENDDDADDIYDDGSSGPLLEDGRPLPVLPSINSLPGYHQTSAGSSSSHVQTSGTSENTGSGGDSGEIYDPIDGDFDELYEPLDMDKPGDSAAGSDAASLEKDNEAERKRQDKLKKDQERQQKKDEEKRKKEEKEEKKKKEKADKDLKKKFKVKGDWTVLETGSALQDVADENDKFSVVCTNGETLDIIRKDGPNPPGKWLVRNSCGDPGYIDADLVQTAGGDFGDEYDAVGLTGEADFQDVYDIAS